MPKGIMVVETSPLDAEHDDAYNDWYANHHLPEVLAVPGFVGARRFKVHQTAGGGATTSAAGHRYLSIYEIEADDLTAPMLELRARSAAGETTRTDAVQVDPPAVVTLYELLE